MDQFNITGGKKLKGTVRVSGSKNASLPCLFATLLTDEECVLSRVPELADIKTAVQLLETLGKKVVRQGETYTITKKKKLTGHAPYDLVRRMRASVLVMGPLLARRKKAEVSLPGGCAIGARPVNYHLDGFERMGATFAIKEGYIDSKTKGLKGNLIPLAFPSVGATENLMMGAALAEGTTTIQNAAREPEVVDLGLMLEEMGASVKGLETSEIVIEGSKKLHGCKHEVISDRIEAGTFLLAAAITKGDITVEGAEPRHLTALINCMKASGLAVTEEKGGLRAKWVKKLRPINIATDVHPGFPTDMQAQWITVMSLTEGQCSVKESVFENRFLHVHELLRFGANIQLDGRNALVKGVNRFSGCTAMVSDLRAGAALVLAGLAAKGKSTILRVYHLDRGYERMENKLKKLGAVISRSNPS